MAFRVFIDPGHGGTDPGAVFNGRQEKDDVLKLALAVGRILEDQGIDVVYSRTEDFYDSPYEKAMKGNESEADLFLSIHRNSTTLPGSGTGADMLVYADTGFSADVANQIGEAIADTGFQYNGITERPNLAVLRRTKMPAVLVEAGFINNENDNLFFDENFDALAEAIAQGVLNTIDQEQTFDSVSVPELRTDFPQNSAMNTDILSAFTEKDPAEIMQDFLPGSSPSEPEESFFEAEEPDETDSENKLYDSDFFDESGLFNESIQFDRAVSSDSSDRANRPGNPGRPDRPGGPGRPNRPGAPGRPNRPGNPDRPNRPGNPDRPNRPGNPDRPNRPDNPSRPNGPESPGRPDRPGRPGDPGKRLYRVQVGAFTNPMFATQLLNQLLLEGFPAFIVFTDGLYRVQVGAFSVLENAVRMEKRLRNQGYQTYITT